MRAQAAISPRTAGLTVAMIGIAAISIGPALAHVTEGTGPVDWPPEPHAIAVDPTRAEAGMIRELVVVVPDDAAPAPEAGFPPM